jgi:glycosyltransferase involved in cell wall biosynthesis
MSSDIIISVIISTRNRASYLPDCLRSLAAQQGELPHEVIVVDNGSEDETPEVLARWCQEHPEFRSTREERVGLSRGKNAGIRMARAPLLLFTDDDVVVPPGWIRSYAEFFSRHPLDTIVAGGPIIPVPAEDLGAWPSWLDNRALIDLRKLDHGGERELQPPDYVFGANMAVPATVFSRLGLWNEDLGNTPTDRSTFEDTELQDRVWAAGGSVWFCPDTPIQHRVPRASSSPGPILQNAFARGRNDFWKDVRTSTGDLSAAPRISLVRGLAALVWNLLAEGFIMAWFWVSRRATSLERARQAAWRAGRSYETLRPGRDRTRLYGRIGRVTFLARSVLTRLAPQIGGGRSGR